MKLLWAPSGRGALSPSFKSHGTRKAQRPYARPAGRPNPSHIVNRQCIRAYSKAVAVLYIRYGTLNREALVVPVSGLQLQGGTALAHSFDCHALLLPPNPER